LPPAYIEYFLRALRYISMLPAWIYIAYAAGNQYFCVFALFAANPGSQRTNWSHMLAHFKLNFTDTATDTEPQINA